MNKNTKILLTVIKLMYRNLDAYLLMNLSYPAKIMINLKTCYTMLKNIVNKHDIKKDNEIVGAAANRLNKIQQSRNNSGIDYDFVIDENEVSRLAFLDYCEEYIAKHIQINKEISECDRLKLKHICTRINNFIGCIHKELDIIK